ncbi:MAG TPA: glycerol-3-phosphate acyltransferase, partial [Chloroflexota bacterium]|nr:glycerol-3-phosphate acyltransferase [Chloroflexota bacterium]
MATFSLLLATLVSYAVGSIPPGYLVARLSGNVDLRQQGSGRTGTTNVLRTLGWKAAGLVFLGDFAKGAVAIIATRIITGGDPLADLLAGLAVMVGHNYSLYLGFKGGRGVVTGLGVLAAIAPLVLAICGGIG